MLQVDDVWRLFLMTVLFGWLAPLSYKWFKTKTGAHISWNFGVYFVVSKTGDVKAYPDVSPGQLAGVLRGEL